MKVFLKIVENYNLAACSKEQAITKKQKAHVAKATKEKLFHCNKLFAKLKQRKQKREVQAKKSTR